MFLSCAFCTCPRSDVRGSTFRARDEGLALVSAPHSEKFAVSTDREKRHREGDMENERKG